MPQVFELGGGADEARGARHDGMKRERRVGQGGIGSWLNVKHINVRRHALTQTVFDNKAV